MQEERKRRNSMSLFQSHTLGPALLCFGNDSLVTISPSLHLSAVSISLSLSRLMDPLHAPNNP